MQLFGIAAIPGSLLIARLGARRTAIAGTLIVAASSVLRGLGPSVPMLFAMTVVMGADVAIMQPALPTLVGQWFIRRVALATAVYVNGLLIGETLAARRLTSPKVRWRPDWRDVRTSQIGLYFGSNAFLPDYLHAIGRRDLVAVALAALNASQLPASILIMLFGGYLVGRRWP